jgi:hypothetical protein
MTTLKPDKTVEVPPYEKIYLLGSPCLFKHQMEWVVTPKKQYRQEICKKCGTSGVTEKL